MKELKAGGGGGLSKGKGVTKGRGGGVAAPAAKFSLPGSLDDV